MSETSPITAVHELAWTATPLPACDVHGHGSGHLCLSLPEHADLADLKKDVSAWYGVPLPLDVERSHPLLAAFAGAEAAETSVRMYAWACNRRWIGCGVTRSGAGERVVLLFADRAAAAPQAAAEDLSWVERVRAVTGWAEGQQRLAPRMVDWAAAEQSLGTALPDDYKQIAEVFGWGAFDGYLRLHVPGFQPIAFGLIEGSDANRWPILTTDDARVAWQRFEGTTAEFLFRMLTDPLQPFLRAGSQDFPWFARYGPEAAA